jgi:hypothetical protein
MRRKKMVEENQESTPHVSPFDAIRKIDEHGNEYWSSRDLMPLLGYGKKWQNFESVIKKAMTACVLTKQDIALHFLTKHRIQEKENLEIQRTRARSNSVLIVAIHTKLV